MDSKDLWNEICFILSDSVKREIDEKDYENQVVRAIEKLGWSEFNGEIKRQPELQIGRGCVRPDLVLYGPDHRAAVAIEVKRPLENLSKEEPAGQLISYMLQLKADFGLLIGSSIRLFYDGKENPQQKPLLLSRVSFEKDSVEGTTLVSIFQKYDFLKERYRPHINKLIQDFTAARNIKKLTEKLADQETKDKIYEFLRTEFTEFGSDVVDGALKNLKIDLYFDHEPTSKNTLTQIDEKESLLKTVFETILANKDGIAKTELVQITGYNVRQIANAVYKLSKRGAIIIKERGVYAAVTNSIAPKTPKTTSKKPIIKGEQKGSIIESVFKVIKRRKTGFTIEELRNETGLKGRQLSNAIFKLTKRGMIYSKSRGVYVSTLSM